MLKNRSVPIDTVLPHVTYKSVENAIDWLTRVFGFTEHYRYGPPSGPAEGAQMHLGAVYIMLNTLYTGRSSPAQVGQGTQSLTLFVEDVDSHFKRAKSAGAKILEELHETFYGERQYLVEDLEGHLWLFSKHVRDVSPDQWGAQIARSEEDYSAASLPTSPQERDYS